MPQTYSRILEWSKFGTYQQGKIIQVWDSLTSDLRKQITDKIKNISVELENERKQWNVDDWARLIHIWADPNNASVVTKTTEPLTRIRSKTHALFSMGAIGK